MPTEHTLETIAKHLRGQVIGDGAVLIHGVNSLEAARKGELVFAQDARHLSQALLSPASAVIVPLGVDQLGGKPGISVANPKLAFALALDLFYPTLTKPSGTHPTAVLGSNVKLGEHVTIGPHATIGNDVLIGRGTIIESGVHIGDGVTIGEQCFIAPNVVLYRQVSVGNRVRIHGGSVIGGDGFGYVFHDGRYVKVPQVGNVVIEDDVEVGCNVCIDRATVGSTMVRRGTKIDNLVQIAHNDRIGEHVILAGQVGLSGSVTVGNYVVMGGKAGVVDHITIGDRVQVGAASVVTKSVDSGGAIWGYPAGPVREVKRQMAALARLPQLFKEFRRLLILLGRQGRINSDDQEQLRTHGPHEAESGWSGTASHT